jgi:Mitochondrial carrier protein
VTQCILQVARSRMQQRLQGARLEAYRSLPAALVTILSTGGVRALYQGFAANAARVCPQAALQFFLYEKARALLGA